MSRRLSKSAVARVVALAIAAALGIGLQLCPRGVEIGHVLAYFALAAVSVLANWWSALLLVSLLATGVWWILAWLDWKRATGLRIGTYFFVRQLGHIEALFPWAALLASTTWIWPGARLFILAFLVIGVPALLTRFEERGADRARQVDGAPREQEDAFVRRRVWFYVLAAVGEAALLLACRERRVVLPLVLSILGGLCLRALAWHFIQKLPRTATRKHIRTSTYRWARVGDWVFLTLSGATLFLTLFALLTRGSHAEDADAEARRGEARNAPAGTVAPAARFDKEKAEVTVFLVSDNQFHELRGERSGVQLDLVDARVPVAVRPVELDLLSGALFAQLAHVYAAHSKAERPRTPWMHLGDYGDLGCTTELDRAARYLSCFDPDARAALVPGNHDSAFVGNFVWHPSWERACTGNAIGAAGGIADKATSDARLRSAQNGEPLSRVIRLGAFGGSPVFGVVVDTSDIEDLNVGIAGALGGLSGAQRGRLLAELRAALSNGPAEVLFFLHHPLVEMSPRAHRALDALAREVPEGRLLGVISAHTHIAALRTHDFPGHLKVPEIVVGSTTDPPAEAGYLTLSVQGGHKVIAFRTVQAVARSGAVCDPERRSDVDAAYCEAHTPKLDEPSDLSDVRPSKPDDVKAEQQASAAALLERGLDLRSGDHPLDRTDLFELVDDKVLGASGGTCPATIGRDGPAKPLVCMAWVASVMQGKKRCDSACGDHEPLCKASCANLPRKGRLTFAKTRPWAFELEATPPEMEIVFDLTEGRGVQRACHQTF